MSWRAKWGLIALMTIAAFVSTGSLSISRSCCYNRQSRGGLFHSVRRGQCRSSPKVALWLGLRLTVPSAGMFQIRETSRYILSFVWFQGRNQAKILTLWPCAKQESIPVSKECSLYLIIGRRLCGITTRCPRKMIVCLGYWRMVAPVLSASPKSKIRTARILNCIFIQ